MEAETTGARMKKSVGNSSSNPYAKYIFGLPPIPVDPVIKGVQPDDDFETLAPFPPEVVYNKYWFISGFDNENRPILVQAFPRKGNAFYKHFSNSSALKIFSKLSRYRQYILTKAVKIRSTKIKPVTQYVKVNDFIHFDTFAPIFSNPAGAKWFRHLMAKKRQFYKKYQQREIVLNVGVVGELVIRVAAGVLSRRHPVQVYGTDKSTWQPALVKQFPRDQLPEEYCGLRGNVPIKLYPD